MRTNDETMFWRHKVDHNGRLSHLFWCDGAAQRDYTIFGDVVAFDATYKRNKYMCPLVVFSGVNHTKVLFFVLLLYVTKQRNICMVVGTIFGSNGRQKSNVGYYIW
jgi:hypothetical protein